MAEKLEWFIEQWNEQNFLVGQLVHALKTPTAFNDKARDKLKARLTSHGMVYHAGLLDKDLKIEWPKPKRKPDAAL